MVYARLCYINYSFFLSLFNVRLHPHVYTQSPSHMWVSISLWVSRPLYGPWTSSSCFPLPNGLFHLLVHHQWAFTCQFHTSFYPPWKPRTVAPHHFLAPFATHPLLGLFQDHLCGLYGLSYCNILSPLQPRKGPTLLYFQKGFKYTHFVPAPPAKWTSINICHHFTIPSWALILLVGSQIILSTILTIQNNNHT